VLKDISPLLDSFLYRPQRPNFDRQFKSDDWNEAIDHLMVAGYDFKPEKFSEEGYLFRGMSNGLFEAIKKQTFEHFLNASETNTAEQIMQIYFVTHDLSDAITAACLYELQQDNAVLVFKSSLFNQQLSDGNAAVLNVGDMGIIFRYPFLTQSIKLSDVAYIIVNEAVEKQMLELFPAIAHQILSIPLGQHNEMLIKAKNKLESHGLLAASPQKSSKYPRVQKFR